MTQTSYFWSGAGIGDYQSNYSDDLFALAMLLFFNTNRGDALIAMPTKGDGFLTTTVIEASGGNFVLHPIVALVDGRFYENDADLTLAPASGNGYYAVVLRRDDSGGAGTQTVRAALIYNAGSSPTPTQTQQTWECVIARGQVVAGVAQIDTYHAKPLPSNLVLPVRSGSDRWNWAPPADSTLIVDKPAIQVGVVGITPIGGERTISVTFPETFKAQTAPIVFVTPFNYSGGTPIEALVIIVSVTSDTMFAITLTDDSNIEGFNWFAIGAEDEERF